MNWDRYRTVMERDAIKTDNIAAEDAYFFATHMPFSQLEIYQGGRTSQTPILMNEEEVFQNLVYNPENNHRMIIVRGDNGTGKSHLIRYLKAKFEKSPSTIYNPENEQIIFLRRLNNSVRGVFSQLLEQKAIRDKEVEQKLRKFIASSDSKDESSFKNDILPWLKDYVKPNIRLKDVYLQSAVEQYIDHLEGSFYLQTLQKQLNMNLSNFFYKNFNLDRYQGNYQDR